VGFVSAIAAVMPMGGMPRQMPLRARQALMPRKQMPAAAKISQHVVDGIAGLTLQIAPMAGYWSVAQTEACRENTAARWLAQGGFETYLPKIKITRRVVDRKNHARIVARVVPLFPSYIFVRVVERWYAIASTIGISQILLAGDHPAAIAESEIMRIKSQERGGLIRLPTVQAMKPGDKVRVLRGHFADHIGIYDGMSGRDRQRILLELLGQQVPVQIASVDVMPLCV
jgi:transcriptional antiterminator RfaH